MVACYTKAPEKKVFYISRAYNPNQAFVYVQESSDDKLYLEILSTNVSIIRESYNFDDIEIWIDHTAHVASKVNTTRNNKRNQKFTLH